MRRGLQLLPLTPFCLGDSVGVSDEHLVGLLLLPAFPPSCLPAELEGLHREVLVRALQLLEAQGKVK
jgi:hypothetical protein